MVRPSAAGIYPIAGTPTYVIGAPRFEAVRLGRGETAFTVRDPLGVRDDPNADVSTTWEDEHPGPTLDWEMLRAGGTLQFHDAR